MNHNGKTDKDWQLLLEAIQQGDVRMISRCISWIENEVEGYLDFLEMLEDKPDKKIIGITGPPGAGKSTLVDQLIGHLLESGKKVAVLCIDPSSPFHFGALLGDRIRMSAWYNHPSVFIRSLATRGALGGMHPKIIEITDLLKAADFDFVIVETVGVGQSEVEIAGLADTTVVVLVPEGGDEIQTMKAGLMEIADIFVVNKCDRPEADRFVRNLQHILLPSLHENGKLVPVLETIASEKKGISELAAIITQRPPEHNEKRKWLLTEKAWQLIAQQKMRLVDKKELAGRIEKGILAKKFNLYNLIRTYYF